MAITLTNEPKARAIVLHIILFTNKGEKFIIKLQLAFYSYDNR